MLTGFLRGLAAFAVAALAVAGGSALASGPPSAAPAVSPIGKWLAEDIRGGGVIDRLQTTLEIIADGKAVGSGGCNRISGSATIDGRAIAFGPMAATRKMCMPAVMNQEAKLLAALGEVKAWEADVARGKLILRDGAGAALVVFARID